MFLHASKGLIGLLVEGNGLDSTQV